MELVAGPAPIVRLRATGEDLPESLRCEILALGECPIAELIELVQDAAAGCDAAPGDGWPPIHAVELLVDLKAEAAIGPLLRTLSNASIDEAIRSRIAIRLPELGASVLEPALQLMDEAVDVDAIDALYCVVSQLGVRDERVFERLCKYFDAEKGLGAMCFADYGDSRALPLLATAIESCEPDWGSAVRILDLNELVDAYEMLAGTLPPWLTQRVGALRAKWAAQHAG